ncbi:hypothetical protein PX699_00525 [Sphingobium sp. H39-3-25]|uniref:hypothetical protein n=1 Tax=Sphingobium arseniciresistens TaxID=3030834 RepID=UPI0023B9205D|nr:hypothetical protein [Sphingobium arseniciresistens]
MLKVETKFPFVGSIAAYEGMRWRVQRHNADGTATIARDGTSASFTRDAPIADLIDPAEVDENARITLFELGEATRRLCVFIEEHLRGRNEVILGLLAQVLAFNARKGLIPGHQDNAHIAQCMRALGWRKQGYFGAGRDRSPVYVRPAVVEEAA